MTKSKWLMAMMCIGILVSISTVSIYMPKLIEWYFEPPTANGVSCSPAISWAFHKFQMAQLVSVGVGAVLGLLLGLKITRKKTQ